MAGSTQLTRSGHRERDGHSPVSTHSLAPLLLWTGASSGTPVSDTRVTVSAQASAARSRSFRPGLQQRELLDLHTLLKVATRTVTERAAWGRAHKVTLQSQGLLRKGRSCGGDGRSVRLRLRGSRSFSAPKRPTPATYGWRRSATKGDRSGGAERNRGGGDSRAPLLPSELTMGLGHRCCAIHRDQWGLPPRVLSCYRASPIAWSYRPRQPDLARLLSAIVADGPTGRRLFEDDDVPGGIDDDCANRADR